LSQKNVDFGGGLERMLMVVNNSANVFETDLFKDYIDYIEHNSNKKYKDSPATFEIITDHTRAAVFLIADGAIPSNKDQGYFVRRLIRRALVQIKKIDLEFEDLLVLSNMVIKKMSDVYPNLKDSKNEITNHISAEVKKFSRTLEKGIKYFEKIKPINNLISSEDIFNLFTTYGFPLEIIKELATDKKYKLDEKGFFEKIEAHKKLSRQGAEQKFKSGLADTSEATTKLHTATHLLHEALRRVLGNHVEQKGSNITHERLRFDFSHPEKMTAEQIKEVEKIVNDQIQKHLDVYNEEMSPEQAKNIGAIGLFDAKYGNKVKVYSVGAPLDKAKDSFSREICTGPHVENTGMLGNFRITKEQASSAGIRRIKAILE